MPVLHMGSSLNQGPFRVLFKKVSLGVEARNWRIQSHSLS